MVFEMNLLGFSPKSSHSALNLIRAPSSFDCLYSIDLLFSSFNLAKFSIDGCPLFIRSSTLIISFSRFSFLLHLLPFIFVSSL